MIFGGRRVMKTFAVLLVLLCPVFLLGIFHAGYGGELDDG